MILPARYALMLAAACALLASGAARAASIEAASGRESLQADLAACHAMADAEARRDCRRDAYAARDEQRRGTLTDNGDFERNKFARCEVHKVPAEHDECVRRMSGEGTVSGSVEGGGVLRELRVTVPAN